MPNVCVAHALKSCSSSCSCSKIWGDPASNSWTGVEGLLSRRDGMMVARQFIAWSVADILRPRAANMWCSATHTVPPGRFVFFGRIPGNKLPGYDHPIPSGQSPMRPFGTTNLPDNCPQNRSHPTAPNPFEDDDEDDLRRRHAHTPSPTRHRLKDKTFQIFGLRKMRQNRMIERL
jgi:hypothetical protein